MPEVGPRTPRERAERRVGATLLKWKLDALLGIGGMAAVYAATHRNRSRVALKVLHRELAMNLDVRERFMREAYVANSVGHPGAVQVLDDHVSDDDEPFLVMELLDGQSLEQVQAERGTLPAGEVLEIAAEILDVLAAAHDAGIVHRDVKPQNVFVTRAGQVKVLDFGVARILDGAASATATGSLLGTPAFMPPEQAGGRTHAVCARSDLWSVGATMFTLLTGRFVHEAENAQAHTVKAAVTRARSLATLLPDAPVSLVRLVDRALAFDIADRFADARQMQETVKRTRIVLVPNLAPRDPEEDEEDAETRAFPTGAVRAAVLAAAASKRAIDQDAETDEVPIRRDDGPSLPRTGNEGATDDAEVDAAPPRETPRHARPVPAADPRAPERGAEPPTLAPRAAVVPVVAVRDTAPLSDEVTTGALPASASTSVVLVAPPTFSGARPSNPGALPAPPSPPPPPTPAEDATPTPPATPETSPRSASTTAPFEIGHTQQSAPTALPPIDRTLPLGVAPLPSLSSTGSGEHRSPLATAPLSLAFAPEVSLPRADLHAPTDPSLSSYSNPAATSVGAQSISQISPPATPGRARLGRAEIAAIVGALAAILIVAVLVLRAILGGDESTSSAGGGIATSASSAPEPASAGAPTGATPTLSATATAGTTIPPEPGTAAGQSSASAPTSSSSTSAAPKTPAQIYRPPPDPGTIRWPEKKKKLGPSGQ